MPILEEKGHDEEDDQAHGSDKTVPCPPCLSFPNLMSLDVSSHVFKLAMRTLFDSV